MDFRKILGLLAVGGLLVFGAPTQQAQAASPLNPGVAVALQEGSSSLTTQVQYRRHHRHYNHRRAIRRHHYHAPRIYMPHRHHHHHRYHRHHRR